MNKQDIFVGEQYHYGTADGPIVIVYSIHDHIDNHYYIEYENGSVDTSRRELLFPMEEKE